MEDGFWCYTAVRRYFPSGGVSMEIYNDCERDGKITRAVYVERPLEGERNGMRARGMGGAIG